MTPTLRQYGKKETRKPRSQRLFEELPRSPTCERSATDAMPLKDQDVNKLTERLGAVNLVGKDAAGSLKVPKRSTRESARTSPRTHKAAAVSPPASNDPRTEDTQEQEEEAEPPQARGRKSKKASGDDKKPTRTKQKAETKKKGRKRAESVVEEPETEPAIAPEPSEDIEAKPTKTKTKVKTTKTKGKAKATTKTEDDTTSAKAKTKTKPRPKPKPEPSSSTPSQTSQESTQYSSTTTATSSSFSSPTTSPLRQLTWPELCPPTSTIEKIAEASFAEIYRVANPLGTSIIKVIRLSSPLRPLTKAQVAAGLIDELPHDHESTTSELQISQYLAPVPGFVSYKEKFLVVGKTTPALLATHQGFQRRMKRLDPGRAQYYPSPSRYLEGTEFLVVELGDAGVALEEFGIGEVGGISEVWDIFLLLALALARAEELAGFEHRDLHEGNLCVRRVREPTSPEVKASAQAGHEGDMRRFGFSGLDITILDYGLSRAENPDSSFLADTTAEEEELIRQQLSGESRGDGAGAGGSGGQEEIVAFADLEQDLSLFTSTHAAQCEVYRRMRSHLLLCRGKDLLPLDDASYQSPYPVTASGEKLDWGVYAPYTNVLWLGYIYGFLTKMWQGDEGVIKGFRDETAEMWGFLDPQGEGVGFGCAADVVRFAVGMGWVGEEQILGGGGSFLGGDEVDGVAEQMGGMEVVDEGAVEESQGRRRKAAREDRGA